MSQIPPVSPTPEEQAALDRVPSITLAEIKKVGLFYPVPFLDRFVFRMHPKAGEAYKEYVVRNDRGRSLLIFIEEEKPQVKPIEVEYVEHNGHFFCICGPDRAETATLYFYKGRIVSRDFILEALRPKRPEVKLAETLARLEGADGRGPSRGATRARLLESLRKGPFRADIRVQKLLIAEENRPKRRIKRPVGAPTKGHDPLDTRSGLSRCEGLPATPSDGLAWKSFEEALQRRVCKGVLGGPPLRGEPLPTHLGRGVLEDHPRLDIRTLAKTGCLQPGERRRGVLDWSGATPLIDGLRFIADLRCGASPHMELEMMRDGVAHYQLLRLTRSDQGGRVRWGFLCPVSGRASEVLALRYGRFASAKAQRLVHRSQVGKPRRRGGGEAKA